MFPVADADTGTNMLFTMRSAWAQADACTGVDDVDPGGGRARRGALHGARGNSGVILSQILRGLADVTAAAAADRRRGTGRHRRRALRRRAAARGRPGRHVDGRNSARHHRLGASDAAGAAEHAAADGADLADVVVAAAGAAAVALDKTTEQLDVLAEAGVVDAGGRGLLVLLDAMSRDPGRARPAPARVSAVAAAARGRTTSTAAPPQFEVMYLLSGCDARRRRDAARNGWIELGESVAIAASADGGWPLLGPRARRRRRCRGGGGAGGRHAKPDPDHVAQSAAPVRRPAGGWSRERAVLAVVDGDGAEELFAGEGAHVLRPDSDAPVSAKQLLHALVNAGAAQIMVLPNGYVAAEELVAGCTAAIGWGIDVVPVPAGSMVQGLAALAVHDADRQAVDDGYTMARAAAGARHGSVRVATEEALTWAGTCKPGDGLGIAGDEVLIVGGDRHRGRGRADRSAARRRR